MTRLREALPQTDKGIAFLLGLSLVSTGFLFAQFLASILYAPLALIVPGSVLTILALITPVPVEEDRE